MQRHREKGKDMGKQAIRWVRSAGAVWAALWLSGCIAIPLGGTQTITGSWNDGEQPTQTKSIDSAVLRESVVPRGNDALEVGFELALAETTVVKQKVHTVSVAKKTWLGVGLFPGYAEEQYAPQNGLKAAENSMPEIQIGTLLTLLGSPLSLVAWPFQPSGCSSHYWQGPNADALLHLSAAERAKIGARIEGDGLPFPSAATYDFTHMVLGCLKYCTYVVSDPAETETVERRTSERRVPIRGPYAAELSIPSLDWKARATVKTGETRTVFALPFAFPAGTYEAKIRFAFQPERIVAEKSAPFRRALEAENGHFRSIRFTIGE
jgi:hypothetical protein